MKWFPFAILALAVAGLALTLVLPFYLVSVGSTLQTVALCLTAIVKQKGPLRQASLSEPADEREDAWRDRANLNAYGTVGCVRCRIEPRAAFALALSKSCNPSATRRQCASASASTPTSAAKRSVI